MRTITFEEVTDWLAKQPGHRTFDMTDGHACLVASYLAAETIDGNLDPTHRAWAGETFAMDIFGNKCLIEDRLSKVVAAGFHHSRINGATTTNQLLLLAFPDKDAPA